MRREVLEKTRIGGKLYKFVGHNQLGEKITVLIRKAKTDAGDGNCHKYWLSVVTLVTDKWGNVQEKYNPQVKVVDGQRVIDRVWVLEPNAENTQRLLEQVERLAFGGQ